MQEEGDGLLWSRWEIIDPPGGGQSGEGSGLTFTNVIRRPHKEEVDQEGDPSPGNEKGVKPGDTITYRIHWQNYRKEPATVEVIDILDENVEFVSAEPEYTLYLGSPESDSNAYRDLFSETSADAYRKDLGYQGRGVVYWKLENVPGTEEAEKQGPEKDGPREGLYPNEGYIYLTVRVKDGAYDTTVFNQAAVGVENEPFIRTENVKNPTPEKPPTVSLRIQKTVKSEIGEDLNAEFEFTVRLTDKDGNALPGSYPFRYSDAEGSGAQDAPASGTVADGGTLTLKHGDEIVIEDLPEGTHYAIEEKEYPEFSVTKENAAGTAGEGSTVLVKFVNTRKPEEPPDEPHEPDEPDEPHSPEEPGNPPDTPSRKYPPDDEPGPGQPKEGNPGEPDYPKDHITQTENGPDTPESNATPRTGDTSDPVLWLTLMIFSISGIFAVLKQYRKKDAKLSEQDRQK